MTMGGLSEMAIIHRQLGEIQATLKGVADVMQRDRDDSKEHRENMSQKMQGVEDRVVNLDNRLVALEKISKSNAAKLNDEVMPTVRKINIWEQRGFGFLAFAGLAGTGLGAAMINYMDAIKAFLGGFLK